MCKYSLPLLFFFICSLSAWSSSGGDEVYPDDYVWTSPSIDASGSMPCGGGDIGMNVWVEESGDMLFYVCRSGSFDENNTLLKSGRFRLRLSDADGRSVPFVSQTLCLKDGYLSVRLADAEICFWADVFRPVIHVEVAGKKPLQMAMTYENWRTHHRSIGKVEGQQCSYKWTVNKSVTTSPDSIFATKGAITFFHRNPEKTVFDYTVEMQGLGALKDSIFNPITNLISGGRMVGKGLVYAGTEEGEDNRGVDFRSWSYRSEKVSRNHRVTIALANVQGTVGEWETELEKTLSCINIERDRKASRRWWNDFWKRSYIVAEGEGPHVEAIRNYTLFRYMLGCNAHSQWPTKFNGGLFTFDPAYVNPDMPFTPDFRRWGGGTHTAQNQRLVYWPMLKSGDLDLMLPQFDYYLRLLPVAELRSRHYWGHEGACFVEQIENFGLPNPAEYGKKRPAGFDAGLEYNAWLEYQWDTALEFCLMILQNNYLKQQGLTAKYLPLVESTLQFFDQHYRYLARMRGRKELDGEGKLILYPGSACETYKMAYNASSTVAGLHAVLNAYLSDAEVSRLRCQPDTAAMYTYLQQMQQRLPDIPLRTLEVTDETSSSVSFKPAISPARVWERVNNIETPQLYPVFPWRIYGVGRPHLDVALNTYLYDPDALKFRSSNGWKQDNIWAACLGQTEDAARLMLEKLGNGPHRFPAFWGPGYDWTPDHNWGGSGMIGLQEMLMQEVDGEILAFPAWPKEWNVRFRLHTTDGRVVEAEMHDEGVKLRVD